MPEQLSPELGSGPLSAPLWVLGRDYGNEERVKRQPFVGAAGRILDAALRAAGLVRQQLRIDNLVPIQPPNNDFKKHKPDDLAWGKWRLECLLTQFKPKLIVALGNEASQFLLEDLWPTEGIESLRGYLWDTRFGRVMTTIHPAFVLRAWSPWRALLDLDLRKASRELRLGCPPLDRREVTIVTSTAELDELHEKLGWER